MFAELIYSIHGVVADTNANATESRSRVDKGVFNDLKKKKNQN